MSKRKELRQLRAQMNAMNSNPSGGMSGSAMQQPSVVGATTNKGGYWKDTPGGMMSASQYSPWAQQMMQDQTKQGAAGYAQMNQPWVMDLIKNLMQNGGQGLQGLTDQKFNFGPIADEARANFAQQTIPSIAERFSSLGTGGSQRSSAFPQLLSQAGGDLERQLAALKEQYGLQEKGLNANIFGNMLSGGMNARGQNMGMYGQQLGFASQPVWENMYRPGQQAGWKDTLNSVISGGSKVAGAYLGGRP